MEQTQNTDLRVRRTRKAIREGFFICVREKTFTDVTVSNICNAAMINRSTFYKYYADKYVLRQQIIDDALTAFYENMDLSFFKLDYAKLSELQDQLEKSLAFIYENRALYLHLWKPFMEAHVLEGMSEVVERKMREQIDSFRQSDGALFPGAHELLVRLFASSTLTVIRWWLQYAPQTKRSQVADIIIKNIQIGMLFNMQSETAEAGPPPLGCLVENRCIVRRFK